jgi:hypothetical protein
MGGSKSNSKSNSSTVTTTTTEQKDERVAATDSAIAVGANTTGGITINQLPDGLSDFTISLLDAVEAAGTAAFDLAKSAVDTSEQSVEAANQKSQQYQKYLVIGLAGLAVIALIARSQK